MATTDTYPEVFAALGPQLSEADALRAAIDEKKGLDPTLWESVITKLRTDWTYHSCGIEGSTLTRGETHFFLSEGLTVEGKPFKDFLDARNHAEAIDLFFDVVAGNQAITEGLIKEVNALLLRGVSHTPAKTPTGQAVRKPAHPGQYKREPNHVLKQDGTIHYYVEPIYVKDEMEQLVTWVNQSLNRIHPVHVAAVAHYNQVRIHAFDDGNGRGARFLMNLVLLHKRYFPAVVHLETKRRYLQALNEADSGNLAPFVGYIADTVIATQKSVLDVLEGRSTTHAHLSSTPTAREAGK